MQMRKIWVLCLLVLMLFVSGTRHSCCSEGGTILRAPYQTLRAELLSSIEKEMKKHAVQGLTLILVDGDEIGWAEGFGWADAARKIPATPETIYRLGSISTIMTATAVMQLAEAGLVDLDKSFRTYLPEFDIQSRFGSIDEITARTLLTHHSGLPGDYLSRMWAPNPLDYRKLVELLQTEHTVYPPNFFYAFSNLGYSLLGNMIEEVSDKDFVTYTDERIFAPLQMTNTSFTLKPHMEPYFSKGYLDGKEVRPWGLSTFAAGNLYSNALDMAKFMQMIFHQGSVNGAHILQPVSLEEMHRPQNLGVPLDLDFHTGLAWLIGKLNGEKMIMHSGTTIVFHSKIALLPEEDLGVLILTNTDSGINITDALARAILQRAHELKYGSVVKQQPAEVESISRPTNELKQYEGVYTTQASLVEVRAKRGGLNVTLLGNPLKLIPLENGGFAPRFRLFGFLPLVVRDLSGLAFYFERIADHDVLILSENGVRSVIAEKVEPFTIPDSWRQRVGTYELTNLAENEFASFYDLKLTYKNDFLIFSARVPVYEKMGIEGIDRILRPLSDSEAVLCGLGRNMGDTVRFVQTATGEELHFAGYVFKKKR